jgi:hypothetical protein
MDRMSRAIHRQFDAWKLGRASADGNNGALYVTEDIGHYSEDGNHRVSSAWIIVRQFYVLIAAVL